MGGGTRSRAARARGERIVSLPIDANTRGTLLRRYKRFLADIELDGGGQITAHCADPGGMRDLALPGAAVRCSIHDDPKRKLRHTLELVRSRGVWVGVHPARANGLVRAGLEARIFPFASQYLTFRSEQRTGASRIDFLLEGHDHDAPSLWLEVKSITLAVGRCGRFPDSVTTRGRRHAEELAALSRAGQRAALLFVVQRRDCDWVELADEIDPAYGRALRDAVRDGVSVHAWRARPTARALHLEHPLEVRL